MKRSKEKKKKKKKLINQKPSCRYKYYCCSGARRRDGRRAGAFLILYGRDLSAVKTAPPGHCTSDSDPRSTAARSAMMFRDGGRGCHKRVNDFFRIRRSFPKRGLNVWAHHPAPWKVIPIDLMIFQHRLFTKLHTFFVPCLYNVNAFTG